MQTISLNIQFGLLFLYKFETWLSYCDFSTIRRLYNSSHLPSSSFADILSQGSDEDTITGPNYTGFGGKRNNG